MSPNATDRQSPGTLARAGGPRHVTRQTLSLPRRAVDLLAMKEEARSFEEGGRFADAFALYRVILAHLEEKPATRQVLPFYLKVGELAHRLGDTRTALTTYARGAERFAGQGDAHSVADLCLRILQTEPTRKDVHARFARRLLVHGHVEPARQLLLDYARRARRDNLHRMLARMDRWPEEEVRRLLTDFLDRVVPEDWKRLRTTDPRQSAKAEPPRNVPAAPTPTPSPPPLPDQTSGQPDAPQPSPPRPTETKPPPPVPTTTSPTPPAAAGPAHADELVTGVGMPTRPAVGKPPPERSTTPHRPRTPAPPPSRSRPTAAERSRRSERPMPRSRPVRPTRRRRHRGALIAASVVIVLSVTGAVGYALVPRGVLPFGIKGLASDRAPQEPPSAPVPIAAAIAVEDSAPRRPDPVVDSLGTRPDQEVPSQPGSRQAETDERPAVAAPLPSSPTDDPPPAATERTEAPAAVTPPFARERVIPPTADTVVPPEPDAPSPPASEDVPAEIWSSVPEGPGSPDRLVLVEGFPVLGIEVFDAAAGVGLRLAQELPSGDTLSLTVVPLDSATAGQVAVGRVLVQSSGTSAIGTTRFARYLVTGRAQMSAAGMEYVLGRLVELTRSSGAASVEKR